MIGWVQEIQYHKIRILYATTTPCLKSASAKECNEIKYKLLKPSCRSINCKYRIRTHERLQTDFQKTMVFYPECYKFITKADI